MSQNPLTIADGTGAAVLAEINAALDTLASCSSGASEPANPVAGRLWADTGAGVMKQRNAANTGWNTLFSLSSSLGSAAALNAGTAAGNLVQLVASGKLPALDGSLLTGIAQPVQADPMAFYKADSASPAFVKTGAGTLSVKAGTHAMVAGSLVEFAAQTAVTMPTLTAGTDYAIYACTDGTVRADANWSAPTGYTTGNSRKIGGFHYAPGGNAAARAGGDTTPAINAYSLWDLKFRPACTDPRGMTLVADSFWSDIYLLGVDHLTNGTSKYNVTIADGSSPPKIPTKFGGNGTNAYSTMNWWEANEVLQSYGKRSPTYDEFATLAYGTTEAASSGGTDVPTAGATGTGATSAWNIFTSKWGCIQSSGCMWIWGGEFGGGAAAAGWTANTGGRGSTDQMGNAVLFGGCWVNTSNSGSRASTWSNSPTYSDNYIGARGVCDHLILY